ncbi:membrane protein, partial [Vibrio sp. S457-15]
KGNQRKDSKEKVGNMVDPIADGSSLHYPATGGEAGVQQPAARRADQPIGSADITYSADIDSKVDAAVRKHFFKHPTEQSNNLYRWLTYDLNSDGNEELLVQLAWGGSCGDKTLVVVHHGTACGFHSP